MALTRTSNRKGEPRRGGRPTKKTPEVIQAIYEALLAGGTLTDSAKAAGVGRKTVYDWMAQDAEFAEKVEEAKLERRKLYLTKIQEAAEKGTWQAAAWILERTMPDEFSRNAKVNVSQNGPVVVEQKVTVNEDPKRLSDVLARLALSGAVPLGLGASRVGEGDDAEDDTVHSAGTDSSADSIPAS